MIYALVVIYMAFGIGLPVAMQFRLVRRRTTRRRTPAPAASRVMVQIELVEVSGISQSFLIKPGQRHQAVVAGFVTAASGFKEIEVPVVITAHLA